VEGSCLDEGRRLYGEGCWVWCVCVCVCCYSVRRGAKKVVVVGGGGGGDEEVSM
jgi:hypothetical protein